MPWVSRLHLRKLWGAGTINSSPFDCSAILHSKNMRIVCKLRGFGFLLSICYASATLATSCPDTATPIPPGACRNMQPRHPCVGFRLWRLLDFLCDLVEDYLGWQLCSPSSVRGYLITFTLNSIAVEATLSFTPLQASTSGMVGTSKIVFFSRPKRAHNIICFALYYKTSRILSERCFRHVWYDNILSSVQVTCSCFVWAQLS